MKKIHVWKFLMAQTHPAILLYVLESSGSSPGRQGFLMAVNSRGDMEGSIGGGIMEHKFVELAKEKLKQEQDQSVLRKQVHDKSAGFDQSGMICSGEQTILLYAIKEKDRAEIKKIIQSLEEFTGGSLNLSMKGIRFESGIMNGNYELQGVPGEAWLYKENLAPANKLFIVGGGHCSLALCRIFSQLDFKITVFDDRPGLKTFLENEEAHVKQMVSNYSELGQFITGGANHYVVIATFGYRTDDLALRALINKELKYIGILGSKTKIDTMFAAYRGENIADSLLSRIHAPVGIAINSQTPEEIAISIAAQIIAVKNNASPK
jgi:xanthine dehydrogenase accessory factor